jgi:phosphatidate phosphatase PAH1
MEYKKSLQALELPPTKVSTELDPLQEINKEVLVVESSTQYIEIDDVSDDLDPNEEVKQGEEVQDFDSDFTSLPTKTLFKKAQFILEII